MVPFRYFYNPPLLMNFPRKSGILLHPTSLPGAYGMGEIGPAARQFIQALQSAGQHYWQVLPLGPTGYADSPYQALSTFAGNPMLISFDDLMKDGLLLAEELEDFPQFTTEKVDYGPVLSQRRQILDLVCDKFEKRASADLKVGFKDFCFSQAEWLNDYALFVSIKEQNELRPWVEWAPELVKRTPKALKAFAKKYDALVNRARVRQYLFALQWGRLREFAHEHKVQLIGDIPIFVAHDSADVWANQELFSLDDAGQPTVVAGVPPDYFSATGQLWGNPLYKWALHQKTGYAWWMKRMKHMVGLMDIVRIDHFRGFEAYWEVPGDEETAMNGRWVKGPDHDFFYAMKSELGDIPVIAEDLGVITPEVDQLRDDFELPGMRILQFSFCEGLEPHMEPEGFPENCVVYTGTHDNDTTCGWFRREPGVNNTETAEVIDAERYKVLSMVKTDGEQIHWDLISLAMRLPPHTAIIPLQDVMGLGTEARMNVPGRMDGNWAWRFEWEDLRAEDLERLRAITAWARRL
ncbi:4-alpha-glucanotransferase [Kiritimatiellota bacterium B12222]|nr:4-alpha-glucanotransferase [Kiritimatiellota bacterium B12222]